MPTVKLYTIVTNDEYEFPITELEGAKAVGEFLGLKEGTVRINLMSDKWGKAKYKAYVTGIKHTDRKAYLQEYGRKRIERQKLKAIKEYVN